MDVTNRNQMMEQNEENEEQEFNEYGDKDLLEETSRALDIAAGKEQSPMVVMLASNRSNASSKIYANGGNRIISSER